MTDMSVNSLYPNLIYAPYIPKMSLILGESRIHGARYYTVKLVFGDWDVVEKWAIATFGKETSIWDSACGRWYMNNSSFWFRNEADRTMFILRWS